ncbi:MAG: potassium transporter TrkG [Desulfobacterales bacterium]|nr:potassium transporter TrkG [Desulfobacterales bacterium]
MRYAAFQVTSILTTTGFGTADYEQWPAMSQVYLLFCMFLGASGGSTGGGMKLIRIMLCFKFYKELFARHPDAVTHVKLAGKRVPDEVIHSILGFLALYVALFVTPPSFCPDLAWILSPPWARPPRPLVALVLDSTWFAWRTHQIPLLGKNGSFSGARFSGCLEIYTVIILLCWCSA